MERIWRLKGINNSLEIVFVTFNDITLLDYHFSSKNNVFREKCFFSNFYTLSKDNIHTKTIHGSEWILYNEHLLHTTIDLTSRLSNCFIFFSYHHNHHHNVCMVSNRLLYPHLSLIYESFFTQTRNNDHLIGRKVSASASTFWRISSLKVSTTDNIEYSAFLPKHLNIFLYEHQEDLMVGHWTICTFLQRKKTVH